jgi:phospholipase C
MHAILNIIVLLWNMILNVLFTKQRILVPDATYTDNSPHIKHVVYLVLENRTFDQVLGGMPGVNGADPSRYNLNNAGERIYQTEIEDASIYSLYDPPHYFISALQQMQHENGGFVRKFEDTYPGTMRSAVEIIMQYYRFGSIKALHALAAEYTVADNWFSSVPGSTDPNRQFVFSGTSLGIVTNEEKNAQNAYTQETIFDLLAEAGIPWKIYYEDVPSAIYNRSACKYLNNFTHMGKFYKDAKAGTLPAFSFIDPSYFIFENDMHPCSDLRTGDKLVGSIYNALRSNEGAWKNTLFIITFDEGGGFYDHVIPPAAIAPDDNTTNFAFNQTGFRVPGLLISPYAQQHVDSTFYDHTSVLKFMCDKHGLNPSRLGKRTIVANTFRLSDVADIRLPRVDYDDISTPLFVSINASFILVMIYGVLYIKTVWINIRKMISTLHFN